MRNLCADKAAQRKIESYTLTHSMFLTGIWCIHATTQWDLKQKSRFQQDGQELNSLNLQN